MSVLPPSMKAIVIQEDRTAGFLDRPIPIIDDDEVLVKTAAVALNNSDWKGMSSGFPALFVARAGEVDSIIGWDVGERVPAFVHGGYWRDRGPFSEYVKVRGELLWVLPEKTSFEEAAALSCGTWTVVQSLFHPTRLGLVEPEVEGTPIQRDEWVFVYAGSTSCGMYAIQLLHIAGYKVATTASPRNFNLLKSLGATAVFDYRDPEAVQKSKRLRFSQNAISPEGGKVIVLLPLEYIDIQAPREDVVRQFTFLGTALGKEVAAFGQTFLVSPEDQAQIATFVKKMTILVEQGEASF